MRWPFSKKITIVISVSIIAVLGCAFAIFLVIQESHDTYIKIVDTASTERDTSPSPGADIRAVSIERTNAKTIYIKDVVSFTQPDAASASRNEYANTSVVLGEWNNKKNPPHLALSRGGELIVHIASNYAENDIIHVYETGQNEGRTAEYYEVYIAPQADGPWTLLGKKAGEATFSIPK